MWELARESAFDVLQLETLRGHEKVAGKTIPFLSNAHVDLAWQRDLIVETTLELFDGELRVHLDGCVIVDVRAHRP